MSVKDDPRVIASINRLRHLGLSVIVDNPNPNLVVILIDNESLVKTIKNMIAKSVSYPKYFIYLDKETNVMGLYIWKGEKPKIVQELEMKLQ